MEWTEKQKEVIDTRNRNILVAAAAGSGKTAVLVERIVELVTDKEHPINIDELLVVTFTRAAAAEMKERVRQRLEEMAGKCPEDENLKKQLSYIHNAQITTIDSFCTRVVKEHFEQIEMDPNYRIGDEVELEMMKADIIEELLEECFEEADPDFMNLAEQYTSSKMTDGIGKLINQLYKAAIGQYNPEAWIQNCCKIYEVESEADLEETELYQHFIAYYKELLKDLLEQLVRAEKSLREYGEEKGANTIVYMEDLIRLALTKGQYKGIQEALKPFETTITLKMDKKKVPEDVKNQISGLKAKVVAICRDEMINGSFEQEIGDILADIQNSRSTVKMIQKLTEEFMKRFREKKLEEGVIDFTDQAHLALRILNDRDEEGNLHPSEVARNMAGQFREIMIDEYQDSNYIQEAILSAVSNGQGINNMFMVGDVKQSIYRFRQAEPKLFLHKFDTFSDDLTASDCRIILDKNFRSRREIIDSVNFVFDYLMHKDFGGIDYKGENRLTLGADYDEVPEGQEQNTEFIMLETKDKEKEPLFVAQKILEITNPVTGMKITKKNGELRPVEFKDIAILLRKMQGVSELYQEKLEEWGVPSYAENKTGFYDTLEVRTITDFLSVINNPYQDIPLVAVMTSPMFEFNEEELAKIKIQSQRPQFYEAVEYYFMDGTDEELKQKVEGFLTTLKRFRDMVPYTTVYELIQMILQETGYDLYLQAMPGGKRRQMNLEALKEKAVSYDATSYKGLFNFIRYIERIKELSGDEGESSTVGEHDNLVRIMTIHKSKGLQFPVVFLCETTGRGGGREDEILIDDQGNIGVDCIDPELRTKSKTFYKKCIRQKNEEEELAEKMRLLYVAMTRAEEKLFITGRVSSLEKSIAKFSSQRCNSATVMPTSEIVSNKSFFDWIGNTVGRNQAFEAVTSEPEKGTVHQEYNRDSCFKVSGVTEEEILCGEIGEYLGKEQYKESFQNSMKETAKQMDLEQLRRMVEFDYPYQDYISMYSKASVTEIKKRSMAYEEEQDGFAVFGEKPERTLEEIIPYFEKGTETEFLLTGARRGTAYHRVFELLDMSLEEYSVGVIKAALEEYVSKGMMSREEADCVNPEDIVSFTKTKLFKRMQEAFRREELFRERKFLMGVPASSLAGKEHLKATEDMVVIQGIIDVCFLENGKYVLADYKTDKVRTMQELVDKYQIQLKSYRQALEQIAGIEVTEMIIYSVTLGDEITITD
ncbi:MAG: helicase-exonuclease AddAB subunit AddA [Eubacterium sp.]|nr:helicase-exonuclease AddAB subunit AddA [Eubacterium sp.]